jgi:hypothetical protein
LGDLAKEQRVDFYKGLGGRTCSSQLEARGGKEGFSLEVEVGFGFWVFRFGIYSDFDPLSEKGHGTSIRISDLGSL